MPLAARGYVSLEATGNDLADQVRLVELKDAYIAFMGARTHGFHAARYSSETEMREDLLEPKVLLAASEGRLPLFFVHLSFHTDETSAADLELLEQRFHLVLFTEHVEAEGTR